MRPWIPPAPDPEVIKRDKFHPIASGAVPLEFSPVLSESIKEAKESIAQVVLQKNAESETEPGADVGIISLGTGGSLPSKYRNGKLFYFQAVGMLYDSLFVVLSTLVTIPNWGNIMLDAGEGTWGQMVRNFGLDNSIYNVWQALRDLKCIFISHMHADHHIGLANILAKRKLVSAYVSYLTSRTDAYTQINSLTHPLAIHSMLLQSVGYISTYVKCLRYKILG